jgi:hypothetical protein
MIRLDLPRVPYWLDLPHGVRLLVHPLDTALDAAVRSRAAALVRDLSPATVEPLRLGRVKQTLASAAAEFAILEWSGVLVADGTPAAVTPETTAHLMAIPEMATALLQQLYAPLERVVAEGNGSSAAPNGTSAAALPIARDAVPAVDPAVGGAVPM